jgi:hypothetical protein
MIVGISEDTTWQCEVVARADGYVVQVRDLETRQIDDPEPMLFRTALAAFAYGDFLAAIRRIAAARLGQEDTDELAVELEARRTTFGTVARRLTDCGSDASLLSAWEAYEESRPRRQLH